MAPSLLQRQLLRIRNGVPYYAGLNRAAVGQTPRDLVWQRDTARLWRYRSDQRTCAPPVLIIHSLISKAYILDLLPGNAHSLFVFAVLHQPRKLRRTGHIGPLADHDEYPGLLSEWLRS